MQHAKLKTDEIKYEKYVEVQYIHTKYTKMYTNNFASIDKNIYQCWNTKLKKNMKVYNKL